MEEYEKALQDQQELLASLKKRANGETPFIEFDKLHSGTFMSRYYLTNCLEQGWLDPYKAEVQDLIWGWASEYPEFFAKARRHKWILEGERADEVTFKHACQAPHRYTLHFLLEGWLDPNNEKVKQLIIITLNEGNSNIYIDKGWLTQQEADDILGDFSF